MTSVIKERKPNALINETSPYLLQHAYNPVSWNPWSPSILKYAEQIRKPILLSIGYSSCHWCHVMEKECFENEEIAKLMNEHFLCIKVDREERPDLDESFMEATCALNQGQGGWPMTVFLTPDQKPFFAGTYFPPFDHEGKVGFKSILLKLSSIWEKNPEDILQQAKKLSEHIKKSRPFLQNFPIGNHEITSCVRYYLKHFDLENGGFGPAPKFPPYGPLNLLLRYYKQTENSQVLHMVTKTLDEMMKGGIYDQIGGGFSRYSVDKRWLIPHFEKMLYDNALLAPIYLDAYIITGKIRYKNIAIETLDFILKEMTSLNGVFFSALDADSEGEEGKYYLWDIHEIKDALSDEEYNLIKIHFNISKEGNYNGLNVLNTLHVENLDTYELYLLEKDQNLLKSARSKLFKLRSHRPKPFKDDKVIVSWNALMISALAKAGTVLGKSKYTEAAEKAASFIAKSLTNDQGKILRIYRKGKKSQPGFLEDYAFLAQAYLDLFEYGSSERYLQLSLTITEKLIQGFRDSKTGVFQTCSLDHDEKHKIHQDGSDGAIPNPNAIAALVLAKLSHHFDRVELREFSIQALSSIGRVIHDLPQLYPTSLSAVDFHLEPPINISCIANESNEELQDLLSEIHNVYLPNKIVVHFNKNAKMESSSPILQDKPLLDKKPTVYICKENSCLKPINDRRTIREELHKRESSSRNNIFGFLIPGKATPSGTGFYATSHSKIQFSPMGDTGFLCSPLGYGTYRIYEGEINHKKSLEVALLSGCNLIDTSTNYMDGSAEHCVGTTLRKLTKKNQVSRNQIILITKTGYVQGKSLETAREKEIANTPYPEMSKISDQCWYCIHPQYLEDQLHLSRARLQVETLDFLLIHNPEYFFLAPGNEKKSLKELRTKFYERLEKAFYFLEKQVENGYIQYYGISSNTIADALSSRQKIHFDRILEVAKKAGGENHNLRILQLPLNLIENQAFTRSENILNKAKQNRIAVVVNRPLNAIYKDSMIRLSDFPKKELPLIFDRHVKWGFALEDEWKTTIAPFINLPKSLPLPSQLFNWAQTLHDLRNQKMNLIDWIHLDEEKVTPQLSYLFHLIEQNIRRNTPLHNIWSDWKKRYLLALQPLIQHLKNQATNFSHDQSSIIKECISPFLPKDMGKKPLSRLALWVASSTPGVCSVLNGMRTMAYVQDSLTIMSWKKLDNVLPIYKSLHEKHLFQRRS